MIDQNYTEGGFSDAVFREFYWEKLRRNESNSHHTTS